MHWILRRKTQDSDIRLALLPVPFGPKFAFIHMLTNNQCSHLVSVKVYHYANGDRHFNGRMGAVPILSTTLPTMQL